MRIPPVLMGFPAISLTCFRQMGSFFDAFIHPPGTRLWRHIPLPLMLGALRLIFGETAIATQFVAGEITHSLPMIRMFRDLVLAGNIRAEEAAGELADKVGIEILAVRIPPEACSLVRE